MEQVKRKKYRNELRLMFGPLAVYLIVIKVYAKNDFKLMDDEREFIYANNRR